MCTGNRNPGPFAHHQSEHLGVFDGAQVVIFLRPAKFLVGIGNGGGADDQVDLRIEQFADLIA